MTPPRIQHATIPVPAILLEECARFYEVAFLVRRTATAYPGALWLALADGQQIHLLIDDGATNRRQHVALQVANLAATLVRLRSLDAEVVAGAPLWGAERWYTRDPAGNRLEVFATPPPIW